VARRPESRGQTAGATILVIDDDAVVRNLLGSVLHGQGYEVLLAENGERGVEIFEQCAKRISLVLLDCEMPGMNGDQVFDRLAAMRPDVKVIVSSGKSVADLIALFTGRKVAEFLSKPFTPRTLSETVRAALTA
jgi:DNA-binding NtrC family response regulator